MWALQVSRHEKSDAIGGRRAGAASVAQVADKSRILCGQAAELRPGHPGQAQEALYLA